MLDGVRVLLVEDHDDQRELLGLALSIKGAIVRDAASGEAAVELARIWTPDVVLLDIDLPGIDGIEALTQIRKIAHLQSCPGVVLSGHGREQDRNRSLAAGFGRHLVKPAAVSDIVTAVAIVSSRT